MQNLHIDYWNVVICISKYIKKALGQGLLYEDKRNTQIIGYCDGEWVDILLIEDPTHSREYYLFEEKETKCCLIQCRS